MEDIENIVIPFGTTRIPNSDKPEGYEEVIEDGIDGNRIITRVDGQIVSDKTTHPKNRIIFYGTKEVESEPEEATEQPAENVQMDEYPSIETNVDSTTQSEGHNAIKKAVLEGARLLVFAIPGILITILTDNPELGGSLGATILLVLKSIDRGIHEDKTVESNGLLPF